MDPRSYNFLAAVLGDFGAQALEKAAQRSEELSNALVPRSILAWVRSQSDFDGEVPGTIGVHISFSKSERGFDGAVDVLGEDYKFKGASLFHVAASVATALGVELEPVPAAAHDSDIEKLGRSIDLLARAHAANLQKAEEEKDGQGLPYECPGKDECSNIDCLKCNPKLEKGKDGGKGGGNKGSAAGPTAPTPPIAPTATAPQVAKPKIQAKLPKLPGTAQLPKVRSTTVNLTRSEAEAPCPVCSIPQFKGDEFAGCVCLRALAKSSTVMVLDEHIHIKLGPDWDKEAVVTLLESVGRR